MPGPAPLSSEGLLVLRKAAHVSHNVARGTVTGTRMATAVVSRWWLRASTHARAHGNTRSAAAITPSRRAG